MEAINMKNIQSMWIFKIKKIKLIRMMIIVMMILVLKRNRRRIIKMIRIK